MKPIRFPGPITHKVNTMRREGNFGNNGMLKERTKNNGGMIRQNYVMQHVMKLIFAKST